jgi:putative peptide zinc metalloprotease protein
MPLPKDLSQQMGDQMAEHMALPPLREDLGLHAGPTLKTGIPTWVVEDPLRGRFYRIGWLEFELLSRWSCGDARKLLQLVSQETLLRPSLQEVQAVRQFLLQHELVINEQLMQTAREGQSKQASLPTRALHSYLMFRIPLVNPDQFLARTLPLVRLVLSVQALWMSALVGLVGLFFAFQQWDTFASTFVETLTLQGLMSYSIALAFAKVVHELGHAYTAKQLGLHVPRMGVAIVLLLPMLYTDTGQTWRLPRRRDRFAIAVAGMRIEVMLAAWCTLAWSFLPDGALRSAFFFLATSSWLITLAINASPFLRFDGYYMMSDATGIPNMHDEAARSVKHFVRRYLLGIEDPEPLLEGEPIPKWLLVFGLATMLYRLVLFVGIAVMVYHYFFKLLGIFLFVVEIWWFILRPVWSEVKLWWRERTRIRVMPALRSTLLFSLLLAVLFVPWQGRIFADGWIRAGKETALYAPRPATLNQPIPQGLVQADQVVALLQAQELHLREARASARLGSLDSRLQAVAVNESLPETARSTRAQMAQQRIEAEGVLAEARQLQLNAPFAGQLVDVAHDAHPGSVISRQEVLVRVIDPSSWIAEVFINEDDLNRLRPGAAVKAYLRGVGLDRLDGRVETVDAVPVDQLPAEMLVDRYGGPFLTADDANSLKPRRTLYRVRVHLQGAPRMQQARLASFVIQAQPTSLADSLWRGAMSALVLQASF